MTAWKDLERRVCQALGSRRRGQLGPYGWAQGSDDDGTGPYSVECKRTVRYQLRSAWVDQARRQARHDGRPWLLVIGRHHDRRPIVVMDFWEFAEREQQAGRVPEPLAVE